jgi:hypothetical protein
MDASRGRAGPWGCRLLRGRGSRRLPLRSRLRRAIGLRLRRAVTRLRILLSRWRRVRLSWWRRVRLSRRRRICLSWWRRVRLSRRRRVTLWSRCWPTRSCREVRSDGGAEGVHAFRRTEARAILHWREAADGSRCEAALIRRGGCPRACRGRGRRTIGAAWLRRRLPGLLGRGRILLGRGLRGGRSPRGGRRGLWRGRGWLWRAVCGRCCGGQRVPARQAKLAGGLVRGAAPRTRDHVKTPELETRTRSMRGQAGRAYPVYRVFTRRKAKPPTLSGEFARSLPALA